MAARAPVFAADPYRAAQRAAASYSAGNCRISPKGAGGGRDQRLWAQCELAAQYWGEPKPGGGDRFPTFYCSASHSRSGRGGSGIGGYEQRNRFATPIIRAVLSRLLGWHYDGSDEHHRLVAAQFPFVAFRPQSMPVADLYSDILIMIRKNGTLIAWYREPVRTALASASGRITRTTGDTNDP